MKRRRETLCAAACLIAGYLLASPQALSHAQITTTVQFDREIVRILDNHCVVCHIDKGAAFPLLTYEQTYAVRWQIRMDALTHHMAPWAAVPGFGDFINENNLTQREIDFLVSWAESFGPRNNGAVYARLAATPIAEAPVQAHIDFTSWVLGKPDSVVPLAVKVTSAQLGEVITRTVIDPKLTQERWLRGLEFKPGERRSVHMVAFSVQETGQWLGSWTPWYSSIGLPGQLAYRLTSGSHIVAEIHTYGSKEPMNEEGSVALYFATQPSVRDLSNIVLTPTPDAAPTPSRRFTATRTLDENLNVLALQPVIQAGIQSLEVTARTPDGATKVLLFARDIPLVWPTPYVFREPVALVKGTQLTVTEHYAPGPAAEISPSVRFNAYRGAALAQSGPAPTPTPSVPQRFKLTGTVKSVDGANGQLVVQHGDIPGFMGAMTMTYTVGRNENTASVHAGDRIQSDVVVSDSGTALENIQIIGHGR